MKTHTYLLALILVAFSFGLKANSEDKKNNKEQEARTEILDVVDIENLDMDECVACPVSVKVFDKDFNLVMTGEMSHMHEASSQKLEILLGQSDLLLESGSTLIYQLQ